MWGILVPSEPSDSWPSRPRDTQAAQCAIVVVAAASTGKPSRLPPIHRRTNCSDCRCSPMRQRQLQLGRLTKSADLSGARQVKERESSTPPEERPADDGCRRDTASTSALTFRAERPFRRQLGQPSSCSGASPAPQTAQCVCSLRSERRRRAHPSRASQLTGFVCAILSSPATTIKTTALAIPQLRSKWASSSSWPSLDAHAKR